MSVSNDPCYMPARDWSGLKREQGWKEKKSLLNDELFAMGKGLIITYLFF